MTETTKRARRRRAASLCVREGCKRGVPRVRTENGWLTCGPLCDTVHREQLSAQRVYDATGDTEHLRSIEALASALTAYLASDRRIREAATAVGMTAEQWAALKRGK